MKKWKKFEQLVARVQHQLTPDAVITQNERLLGKVSQVKRELDIVVRSNETCPGFIAFDCKDYKKPVDVKEIEATIGLMKDVEAKLGIVVSARGFSKAALRVGHHAGLKLCKVIDTGEHEWKKKISLPAICYVKNLIANNFIQQFFGKFPRLCLEEPIILYDKDQMALGTQEELLAHWWFDEDRDIENGSNHALDFIPHDVFLLSENQLYPIKVLANIAIEELIFFRKWPLSEFSGLHNQVDGGIETRGFTLSNFSLTELKDNWIKLDLATDPLPDHLITISITTWEII